MLFSLKVHNGAAHDIEGLWKSDARAAAAIVTFLQQGKNDQRLLDSLTIQDFGAAQSQSIHVDKWVAQQKKDRNLWRLKIWSLENLGIRYRVVYALDPRISRYFVLGVFERSFDYDESDPRTQRVLAAYDELGIPAYR